MFFCLFPVIFTVSSDEKEAHETNIQKTSVRCMAITSLDQCSYGYLRCDSCQNTWGWTDDNQDKQTTQFLKKYRVHLCFFLAVLSGTRCRHLACIFLDMLKAYVQNGIQQCAYRGLCASTLLWHRALFIAVMESRKQKSLFYDEAVVEDDWFYVLLQRYCHQWRMQTQQSLKNYSESLLKIKTRIWFDELWVIS